MVALTQSVAFLVHLLYLTEECVFSFLTSPFASQSRNLAKVTIAQRELGIVLVMRTEADFRFLGDTLYISVCRCVKVINVHKRYLYIATERGFCAHNATH